MDAIHLLATTLGLGFAAGLRLYSTVLGLGLAIRFGVLHLPPTLQGLEVLANPAVLIAAGVAFAAEFVGDKIPWVDSVWDAVHTVIRPIGAVVLAATAFADLDPVVRLVLVILCGGVALTSHATKAATRLAVNHSPEPFSNAALSLMGDVAAPFMVWLTTSHPIIALFLVIGFLFVFVWLAGRIWRLLRSGLQRLRRWSMA
ncbi:DUF4126 domain-containing protein [uncultured Paludibaculum sp.]|uniref:DUF4126 domain-containing protein n=1 Tax=uncultured Paludibaculum sp. TaxID=1765020 RepID=UPI002AAB6BCC|nr:DUF4126 domain-containing protein [uncultured Paludibaculum sp.]